MLSVAIRRPLKGLKMGEKYEQITKERDFQWWRQFDVGGEIVANGLGDPSYPGHSNECDLIFMGT